MAAFSSITVETVATRSRSPSDEPNMNRSPAEKPFVSVRPIMDFFDFQRQFKTVATLSYLVCHIIAVQTVTLVWTCSRCGRLPDNCYCHVRGTTQTWVLSVKARLVTPVLQVVISF